MAQCLEVGVASQGRTEVKALESLKEALALYFEPPTPTGAPKLHEIEVELGRA